MSINASSTLLEKLDQAIESVLDKMEAGTPGTESYANLAKQHTELHKSRELLINGMTKLDEAAIKKDESDSRKEEANANAALKRAEEFLKREEAKNLGRVKYDTLFSGGISLLSILIVTNHERLNVITTKALGLVRKA